MNVRKVFLLFMLTLCCTKIVINTGWLGGIDADAATFKLPDSGQSKCYDPSGNTNIEIACAGSGQDAAYNINPMSYIDNGNGTVTDNNTALVWQKCSAGQNNDNSCSGSAVQYNWYQASGTLNATHNPTTIDICGDLTLGGSTNWHLPSSKELTSIVNFGIPHPGPMIQQSRFPNTVPATYWSSTTSASVLYPNRAWFANFYDGFINYDDKSNPLYVRCVSGGL